MHPYLLDSNQSRWLWNLHPTRFFRFLGHTLLACTVRLIGFLDAKLICREVIVPADKSCFDCRADIWSFGLLCVELSRGKPYTQENLSLIQLLYIILSTDPPFLSEETSIEFRDFVSGCLHVSAETRSSASELLSHCFLEMRETCDSFDQRIRKVVDLSV